MKIKIEPYNDDWPKQFSKIKEELGMLLKEFAPKIEHFGSTSIKGLASKPVIDILVGIQDIKYFELITKKIMLNDKYIYYEAFNIFLPQRRLLVRLKDEINPSEFKNIYFNAAEIPHNKINTSRIAHVHIWQYGTKDWIRHIAFREYLKFHKDVCKKYADLKFDLSHRDWENGMEYNKGKNEFIKTEESKAILWYLNKPKNSD